MEQDTTSSQAQELERILKTLQTTTNPLAKAIRKKFQGNDESLSPARMEVRELIDGIIAQVSPAEKKIVTHSFTPDDLIAEYWNQINTRKECATTGFGSLNRALSGGLEQDRLMVLLGAPGSGKTTFSNQIADHVASISRPVLYVTSEDAPFTLLCKTLARRGQVDYSSVLRGYPSEKRRIDAALTEYSQTGYTHFLRYVDATQGITLDAIAEQAEKHFSALADKASGSPLLVVDYLQRLSRCENLGADARQSATVYTERLRAMACDLHCTCIVLSAMNRASGYSSSNSTLSAAKESGDIDYTADVIMAIGPVENAPEPAPGQRQWMIRLDKNRQGATTYDQNHIYLNWYAARQQFTEANPDEVTTVASTGNGRYGKRGGR